MMSKPKILTRKKLRKEVLEQIENFPIEAPRDYNMADWKFEKLIEQIKTFEEDLDDESISQDFAKAFGEEDE